MAYTVEECDSSGHQQSVTVYTADGNLRTLHDIEADIICLAISRYGGRMTEAAHHLHIGRSTLYRKISELGVDPRY